MVGDAAIDERNKALVTTHPKPNSISQHTQPAETTSTTAIAADVPTARKNLLEEDRMPVPNPNQAILEQIHKRYQDEDDDGEY